jgi:hypothetical protein
MSTSHALIGLPIVRSFLEELSSICLSFAADIFTPHSRRLPDYKLREILEEHKAGLPSTAVLKQVSFLLLHPPPQLPARCNVTCLFVIAATFARCGSIGCYGTLRESLGP